MTTSTLKLHTVGPQTSCSPQLTPEDMVAVARAGFRSIINNRPDYEGGPDQPTDAALSTAAQAAGLQYAFVPVTPGQHTPHDVSTMSHLLDTLPQPILLFCRSGARSMHLYQLAVQAH